MGERCIVSPAKILDPRCLATETSGSISCGPRKQFHYGRIDVATEDLVAAAVSHRTSIRVATSANNLSMYSM